MKTNRPTLLAATCAITIGILGCGGGGSSSGGTGGTPLVCGPNYLTPNYVLATDPGDNEQNVILVWPSFPLAVMFETNETANYNSVDYDTNDIFWEGAQRWVAASSGDAQLTQTTNAGAAKIKVNTNRLGAQPGAGGTLAFTTISYFPSTGQIISASIVMNTWPNMTEAQFVDGLKHTFTHEMGHALFLQGHSDQMNDVMYYAGSASVDSPLTTRDMNSFLTAYCGDFNGSALIATGRVGEQPATITIECKR